MANPSGGGLPVITTEPVKRCSICNVPFFIPELINVHYKHHVTPKICLVVSSDEDGNQKYIELTQQQALQYNAGLLPILQTTDGGQQQYIIADPSTNFKAFDANGQQLIATTAAYSQSAAAAGLGTEVEMVHYVDSAGNELTHEEVQQYYALDNQEFSVIQANEEIVVSTEAATRLAQPQHQQVVAAAMPAVAAATGTKSKSRAPAKRKNPSAAAANEPAKTFARRGTAQQQQQQQQQQPNGAVDSMCKKLLLSRDLPPSYAETTSAKVQKGLQQQGKQVQGVTYTNHLQQVPSQQSSVSKLKQDPDLITPDVAHSLPSSSTKHSTLKLDQRPGEPQQYIVLAYDSNGGVHHYEQTTSAEAKAQNFDLKEEKLSV